MKEPNLVIENLKAILEECTASEDAVSYVNSEDAGTLNAAIEALKKQEKDRWIPVSERLPSNHGNYLIYTSDTESDYEEVDIGTFDELRCKWSACDAHGFYWLKDRGIKVIAWRPIIVPHIKGD